MLGVLLTVFSTLFVQAGNSPEGYDYCNVVQVKEGEIFRVLYQSQREQPVRIKLYDSKNNLVHWERVRLGEGVAMDFDLSNLPDGSYNFKIESGDFTFNKEVQRTTWKGEGLTVTSVDGKVILVGTNPVDSDLAVRIDDQSGRELYFGSFEAMSEIKKVYTFENLQVDQVQITLSNLDGIVKSTSLDLY